MLPLERQNQILEILARRKAVSVEELCQLVYSSGATVRRDLTVLEAAGQIRRTHGGAVYVEGGAADSPLMLRESENRQAKGIVAQRAEVFIRDGQTIFLDSSSTAGMLAALLGGYKNMRVITNSLKTVNLLAEAGGIEVYCTGGRLRESARSMVGPAAARFLAAFRTDYAFISCRGVDPVFGVTEASEEEAAVKIAAMQNAARTVLLCDASKLEKQYFCKVCELAQLWQIVTDTTLSAAYTRQLRSRAERAEKKER